VLPAFAYAFQVRTEVTNYVSLAICTLVAYRPDTPSPVVPLGRGQVLPYVYQNASSSERCPVARGCMLHGHVRDLGGFRSFRSMRCSLAPPDAVPDDSRFPQSDLLSGCSVWCTRKRMLLHRTVDLRNRILAMMKQVSERTSTLGNKSRNFDAPALASHQAVT